jgi:hypothetical protein
MFIPLLTTAVASYFLRSWCFVSIYNKFSKFTLSFTYSKQIQLRISLLLSTCHMTCQSHPPLFVHKITLAEHYKPEVMSSTNFLTLCKLILILSTALRYFLNNILYLFTFLIVHLRVTRLAKIILYQLTTVQAATPATVQFAGRQRLS